METKYKPKDSRYDNLRKGERSEAIILAHLLQLDFPVSIPFGRTERYDLIIDNGGKLEKCQCKTGQYKRGSIYFPVCSRGINGRTDYHGQIDYFLVYCPYNNSIYKVPVALSGSNTMVLRLDPFKANAPRAKMHMANDYQI